jgi:chromosome segregation ATPase
LHQLDEERRFAVDDAERLKQNLVMREEVISSDSKKMANLVLEKDELANEVARVRKENARLHEANQRQSDELAAREHELQVEREALARDKAEVDVTRENVDSHVGALEEDLRRAQKVIAEMKAKSADTEVEILQLQKTRAKEREDKEGLEIALQAKQQELEMVSLSIRYRRWKLMKPIRSNVN